MDVSTVRARSLCVVIHSNPLVQQDLKETLIAAGATHVETARSLRKVSVQPSRIVFIEGKFEHVVALPQVQQWVTLDTPVVVINGHKASFAHGYKNMHVLEQPFRSEDVAGLLDELRVF